MRIHRFIRPLVLASLLLALSAASFAGVFVSVSVAPPPIPVYTQPLCPGPGYMWTPGYWAWGDDGYYWVPGTWVMAPEPGLLWTPGYWGWSGGAYIFNAGYWGPHVGWYGGINYGFGFGGRGYEGGEWRGRNFYYNRTVNNVNVTNITNVYNKTVIVNNNNHVSYNGGNGGVHAQPGPHERQYEHERHIQPTQDQSRHFQEAGRNPQFLAKNNGGRPAVAATSRPGDFGHGVVGARAAGGRVDRASLTANPKNMPAPRDNAAQTRNNNSGNRGGGNVPKPPSATASTRGNASPNNTGRNVPRPSNQPDRTYGRNNTAASAPRNAPAPRAENTSRNAPRPSAPVRESAPQRNAPQNSAPQERSAPQHNAPAPRASAPQQHSAPAEHGGQGHEAPQHNDKPHR